MSAGVDQWDIVVVSHNSASELEGIWAAQPSAVRARVIAVDNDSSDDSAAISRAIFARSTSEPNHGLSRSNNIGFAQGSAKYVLFVNPDVVVTVPGLAKLATHLDKHDGLVAPRLLFRDGVPQENARGVPNFATQVLNRLLPPKLRTSYRWPVPHDSIAEVPWVLGAAIAARRATLEAVGGWPEDYFLYYEDVELCCRARDMGLPVMVRGDVRWVHHWERASRSVASKSSRLHMQSAMKFFRSRPALILRARYKSAG